MRQNKRKKKRPGNCTKNRYRERDPLVHMLRNPIKTQNWRPHYIHREAMKGKKDKITFF